MQQQLGPLPGQQWDLNVAPHHGAQLVLHPAAPQLDLNVPVPPIADPMNADLEPEGPLAP